MARKRRALTASGTTPQNLEFAMAVPVPSGNSQLGSSALRKLPDFKPISTPKTDAEWKEAAIGYFNSLGEVNAVIELTAKMVSACRLRAAGYNALGDTCDTTDERVQRVMRAFVGPDQGQRMLLRKAALNLQVTGECYLVGMPHEGPAIDGGKASAASEMLYWEFLSTKEITFSEKGGEKQVFRDASGSGSGGSGFGKPQNDAGKLPLDCFIARLHRSELCYSERSTSQLRAALLICKELQALTDEILASSSSRLNAGILFVPQEFSFGMKDGWPTGDGLEDDDLDELTEVLSEHLTAPVTNKQSQASLVPLIMRGPAEHADAIKWIQVSRESTDANSKLRDELRSRLADALDVPRETMLGKGCVPDDVEILTREGWKTVDELEIGDETLGLDHATGLSRWSPITAINLFENSDPLFSFESSVHSSLTTPNHRWPVERFMCGECTERLSTSKGRCLRCWKRAKAATGAPPEAIPDLVQRVWVTSEEVQPGDRIVLGAPNADIPTVAKFSDAAVELCAWLATDGDRLRGQARIRQSPTANPENCARIAAALEAEGIKASVADDPAVGVRSWVFPMPDVLEWAGTRSIIPASMVTSLTRSQLALMLEVGVVANGHCQAGSSSMFALDENRLDAFELAAILSGFRVSRTIHRQGAAAFGTDDLTRLSWGPKTRTSITAASEVEHVGRVWCPTVEGTESWLARSGDRNTTYYTGNSLNHWCVDSRTKVYTRLGWKSHQEISLGDEVWTLNHDNGQGEWAPVTDMYTADVIDEPMIFMEGKSHRSLTTPDHRWPVLGQSGKAKWTTTAEASDSDRIVLSAPAEDIDHKYTDDFVRLLGWYSAEGTLTRREDGVTPNQIRIGQNHVVNPEHTAEIRRILCSVFGQTGWTEATESQRDMTIFTLHAASRNAILDVVPGFEKIVPTNLIDQFSPTQARLFVEAFTAADGSVDGKYSVIHQVSEARVDSIERACTRAGIATRRWIRTRNEGESFSTNDQHHISIKHRTTATSFQTRTVTGYTGTIWCPVTRNRSWYAQKDGYSFFTGNTGFNIDTDLVTKHILPIGQLIAEFVAASYLRPMLEEYEGMTAQEASEFTVVFDASAVVARNDEAKTSQTLFKMGCLGKKTLLRSNGYSEADLPTDEEAAQIFLLEGLRLAPVSYRWAIPFIDIFKHLEINPAIAGGLLEPEAVDEDGNIDLERAIGPSGVGDETSVPTNSDPDVGEDTNETNSRPPTESGPNTPASIKEQRFELDRERLIDRLAVAADAAYATAMERAASRFLSKATVPERVNRTEKFMLMSRIGPADLERVGESPESMLEGAWDQLGVRVRPWVRNLFAGNPSNVDMANAVVAQLRANMHAFAIASFHNEPTLQDRDVYVPTELIIHALEAAQSGEPVPV